jgi:hypothetical protein
MRPEWSSDLQGWPSEGTDPSFRVRPPLTREPLAVPSWDTKRLLTVSLPCLNTRVVDLRGCGPLGESVDRLLGPCADHVGQGLVPGDEQVRPSDHLGPLKHVSSLHVTQGEPAHAWTVCGWKGRHDRRETR